MPRKIYCVEYDKLGRRHTKEKILDTTAAQDALYEKMCLFTNKHAATLGNAIKGRLVEKSPLRKYEHVIQLGSDEYPMLGGAKKGYCSSCGDGSPVKIKSEKHNRGIPISPIPLIEIACNPEFECTSFKNSFFKSVIDKIVKSDIFLKTEQQCWDSLQEKIPGGHVRCFIRTDVTVLSSNDPVSNRLGFSIFENIAVVITE